MDSEWGGRVALERSRRARRMALRLLLRLLVVVAVASGGVHGACPYTVTMLRG